MREKMVMNTKTMTSTTLMNRNEQLFITSILIAVAVLTSFDIYTDYFEGVIWWHLAIEGFVAIIALWGIYILIKGRFNLQHSLAREKEQATKLEAENRKWKRVSKSYLEGLSKEIDRQLNEWDLTEAERDVSFLILKGFSIKEIAQIRDTSSKTVRTQMNAIYSKSGLAGRSQLSAFFLEDLLLPAHSNQSSSTDETG